MLKIKNGHIFQAFFFLESFTQVYGVYPAISAGF